MVSEESIQLVIFFYVNSHLAAAAFTFQDIRPLAKLFSAVFDHKLAELYFFNDLDFPESFIQDYDCYNAKNCFFITKKSENSANGRL